MDLSLGTVGKILGVGTALYLAHSVSRTPEGHELSGLDAVWLLMDNNPSNVIVVNGVMTFDTKMEDEQVLKMVRERFLVQPRFRMRVVARKRGFGQDQSSALMDPNDSSMFIKPEFEVCDVDLARHIFRQTLPCKPPSSCMPKGFSLEEAAIKDKKRRSQPQQVFGRRQSQIDSDKDLLDYVSLVSTIPLSFENPLWQIHVLDGYATGCAIVFRIHHCIADGVGLMKLLLSLADDKPQRKSSADVSKGLDARTVASTSARRFASEKKNPLLKAFQAIIQTAKWPFHFIFAFLRLIFMRPDQKTLFKGKLGVQKRAVWSAQIPLSSVKRIAATTKGTVNDVIVAISSGAMRRYLERRGEKVDDVQMRALVPFNLQPLDSRVELRNDFSLLYLPLPISEGSSQRRINFVSRVMGYMKIGAEPLVNLWTMQLGSRILPLGLLRLFFAYYSHMASIIMTNVPGPTVPLYIQGHEIKQLFAWVPQSGSVGLGMSIFSYNGNFRVGFLADAHLVEDAQEIVNEIEDEIRGFLMGSTSDGVVGSQDNISRL